MQPRVRAYQEYRFSPTDILRRPEGASVPKSGTPQMAGDISTGMVANDEGAVFTED